MTPLHDHSAIYSLKNNEECQWGLRSDVRRVMLYEKLCDAEALEKAVLLHPTEAIMLTLLDGTTPLGEVERRAAFLFNLAAEEACAKIEALLGRHSEALQQGLAPSARRYDPREFIIPAHQVDLETKRLYKPIGMTIHVSDDCMRKCIYCNIHKRRTAELSNLTLERWDELIDECARLGMVSVSLSGGDPFMRRDVPEIVAALTSRGIHPFCATKSHISRAMAERLAAAGLKRLQVSIDAPTPGLADLMAGSRGYFDGATSSIRNVRAAGITVRTNCVMTRLNARYAEQLVPMLADLGVDTVSITGFARSAYVKDDLNEALFIDAADRQLLEGLRDRFPQVRLRISVQNDAGEMSVRERTAAFGGRAQCSAGRWGFIAHSDGKATLCDEMPVNDFHVIGDLTTQSIMEVWQAPKVLELLEPPREKFRGTPCFTCSEYWECHHEYGRCFRDSMKAFGAFYAPSPNCPRAPTGLRQT
jgi:MoaA/NifB/PqqE/SkfB family radical SAM enzyme